MQPPGCILEQFEPKCNRLVACFLPGMMTVPWIPLHAVVASHTKTGKDVPRQTVRSLVKLDSAARHQRAANIRLAFEDANRCVEVFAGPVKVWPGALPGRGLGNRVEPMPGGERRCCWLGRRLLPDRVVGRFRGEQRRRSRQHESEQRGVAGNPCGCTETAISDYSIRSALSGRTGYRNSQA